MGYSSLDLLSYDNHPLFEGLHLLSTSSKAFYNSFFSFGEDISDGCKITWAPFRRTLLVDLLGASSKLEWQAVSQITQKVLFEAVGVVEAVEDMGVRVGCFNNIIKKILKAKHHQKLSYNIDLIREQMEDLQRQLDSLVDELR